MILIDVLLIMYKIIIWFICKLKECIEVFNDTSIMTRLFQSNMYLCTKLFFFCTVHTKKKTVPIYIVNCFTVTVLPKKSLLSQYYYSNFFFPVLQYQFNVLLLTKPILPVKLVIWQCVLYLIPGSAVSHKIKLLPQQHYFYKNRNNV